jgi:3-oxoadipate enol-lactonase
VTVDLHHVLEGPPDAPVVLFSGSLGSDVTMWDDQAALAGRYRVLRIDHRGHGGSPVPDGPYSIDEMADDVLALLDRLGLERVAYCGLSLGGMVGLALAIRAPERIERLVLACTSAHVPPAEMWLDRAASVRAEGMAAIAPATLGRWLTPPATQRDRLERMLLAVPPEGYAGACEAIAAHDLRDRVGAIRAPTLAIAATEDPATPPAHLEALRDAIPGARLEVLSGTAHLANVDSPEAFNAALERFLERSID